MIKQTDTFYKEPFKNLKCCFSNVIIRTEARVRIPPPPPPCTMPSYYAPCTMLLPSFDRTRSVYICKLEARFFSFLYILTRIGSSLTFLYTTIIDD